MIPALDEAPRIVDTIDQARAALGADTEIVVADGGSSDGTREIATRHALVVRAPRGRGSQLNAGARRARGRFLLFLHADTHLPPGAGRAVREALARPGVAGGCFRFELDPASPPLSRWRLLELAVRLRTSLFRTATGDQALFTTRTRFEQVGGFPEYPLFEDVEFVRRLRGAGRFVTLDAPARTSRRRWERRGFWRTVGTHLLLRLAFRAGVSPCRLARWYG